MNTLKSVYTFVTSHKAEIAAVAAYLAANVPALAAYLPPPLGAVASAIAVIAGAIAGHKMASPS